MDDGMYEIQGFLREHIGKFAWSLPIRVIRLFGHLCALSFSSKEGLCYLLNTKLESSRM